MCVFICNDDYHLIGSDSRTCGDDGNWNGTDTTCERPAGKSSLLAPYIHTPGQVSMTIVLEYTSGKLVL